ncbi:acyl-CoA dehydrogenase [Microbispora sp. NPDC049125]|uniref:acyl-CoA dehydrogenase n=1 Tax=Microbispora sp. NPDC049125 TaxID=3154929 RepID=UPI0034672E76
MRSTATVAGAPAATLEELLGDPYDAGNPCGHAAVLAADERREPLAAAERVLDGWRLNAEFVPVALGGRLDRVQDLITRLRPVFRRDPALGLGYGVTSFMAAANVWLAGNDLQRRRVADLLLRGERLSVAYHELAHGNDLMRNELAARPDGDRFVVSGRKEVINNASRAAGAVLFARTGDRPGRTHSLMLVETGSLPADRWEVLPRFRTGGMRGCLISGFAFDDCPVPATGLLGGLGEGPETALRSFQVSRCVTAGLGLGAVDAALACVLRFARGRHLYGRTVADIPHARDVLAGVFADLLAADCLVTTVARSLHLLPVHASRYAAAVKYLVPLLLEDAMRSLGVVLGARGYLREGEHAIFSKLTRDLPVLGIGHAGGTACQLTILPQLPGVARAAHSSAEAPAAVFRRGDPVPPLDLGALRMMGHGDDPLIGSLLAAADDRTSPDLRELAGIFRADLFDLARKIAALPPAERGVQASAPAFRLTERYALLLAASACLNTRRHHDGDPFLGGDDWLRAALSRLAVRLARANTSRPHSPEAHGRDMTAPLFTELLRRADAGLGFCADVEPVSRPLS